MKKFLITLIVAGLAGAGALLAGPAQSADYEGCVSDAGLPADAGIGDACGGASADGTGYGYVDGAEANADPADGFISVANDGSQDEDGVCASSQGDAGEEYDEEGNAIEDDDETPACDDALPGAVAGQITGAAGL
jgi:hypothetical protein